jgi:phosphatidylglycerophosphate synthase
MLIGPGKLPFYIAIGERGKFSIKSYLFKLMGGFLFQAASVLDGVDGEWQKFTLKVSKIGGVA